MPNRCSCAARPLGRCSRPSAAGCAAALRWPYWRSAVCLAAARSSCDAAARHLRRWGCELGEMNDISTGQWPALSTWTLENVRRERSMSTNLLSCWFICRKVMTCRLLETLGSMDSSSQMYCSTGASIRSVPSRVLPAFFRPMCVCVGGGYGRGVVSRVDKAAGTNDRSWPQTDREDAGAHRSRHSARLQPETDPPGFAGDGMFV